MTPSELKPGDLIKWVYTRNGNEVVTHEEIWSSVEHRFVLIGGVNLLVARAEGILTWLNCNGLSRALEGSHVIGAIFRAVRIAKTSDVP